MLMVMTILILFLKKSCGFQFLHRVRSGPGKPGKSWNFVFLAFQAWKVMEFCVELCKVMENLITIKKYELIFIMYHDGQKFH